MKKPETEKKQRQDIELEAAELEHEAAEARKAAENAESAGNLAEAERHRKIMIEKKAAAQKLRDSIHEK